jgi:hypothetical protein
MLYLDLEGRRSVEVDVLAQIQESDIAVFMVYIETGKGIERLTASWAIRHRYLVGSHSTEGSSQRTECQLMPPPTFL